MTSWEENSLSAQVDRKYVVIVLVFVVAVQVAWDVTKTQKASHHRSRPVSGSGCHYFGQKSMVVQEPFKLINYENRECEIDKMNEELCKILISRLERVPVPSPQNQNRVILLDKKFCVCRPIDTPESEVDTRKSRFWCVEVGNPCDTSSDTAKFCCVWDTACPAKETIFTPCRPFSEKLFSCGHGVSSLRIGLTHGQHC